MRNMLRSSVVAIALIAGTSPVRADINDVLTAGVQHLNDAQYLMSPNALLNAKEAFQSVLEADADNAKAMAGLGWVYRTMAALEIDSEGPIHLAKAWELAQNSIQVEDNALARRLLAKQHLDLDVQVVWGMSVVTQETDKAIQELDIALSLEPDSADIYAEQSYNQMFAGNLERARDLINKSFELNTAAPNWYYKVRGFIGLLEMNLNDAESDLDRFFTTEGLTTPHYHNDSAMFPLASVLGHKGNRKKALDVLLREGELPDHVTVLGRGMAGNLFAVRRIFPLQDDSHMAVLLDGLQKMGMPEFPQATQ